MKEILNKLSFVRPIKLSKRYKATGKSIDTIVDNFSKLPSKEEIIKRKND